MNLDLLHLVFIQECIQRIGEYVGGGEKAFLALGSSRMGFHGYLGVDIPKCWGIVEDELPVLEREVAEMITKIESGD